MENPFDISTLDIISIYEKHEPAKEKDELTPPEIRLLSKLNRKSVGGVNIPRYFEKYGFNYKNVLSKFFSQGYLEISTVRKMQCMILTQAGKELLDKNDALLLSYNGLSQEYVSTEDIIEEQRKNIGINSLELLASIYEKRLASCLPIGDIKMRLGLCIDLQKIYRWKKDDIMQADVQARIDALYAEMDIEQQKNAALAEKQLGIPQNELDRLYHEAVKDMDDDWIKEIDKRNRSKAEIE